MSIYETLNKVEEKNRFRELTFKLSRNALNKHVPLSGGFELTPRCTLDCKMCYMHLRPDQMYRPELTTDEWMILCKDAVSSGLQYATLTGGEPLLHPGFKKIYKYLHDSGVFVYVLTNGFLLDEEMARFLREHYPITVQLSVYGHTPEVYEKVTGNAEGYFRMEKAAHLLNDSGIAFNLAVTLSRYNYEYLDDLLDYCKKLNPTDYSIASFMTDCREETGRALSDYSLSLEEEVVVIKKQSYFKSGWSAPERTDEEVIEDLRSRTKEKFIKYGTKCAAGKFRFWITWDGRMQPCFGLTCSVAQPLDVGFGNAWNQITKETALIPNPAECENCDYLGICKHCMGFHYDDTKCYGKASPRLCLQGKRFFKARLL